MERRGPIFANATMGKTIFYKKTRTRSSCHFQFVKILKCEGMGLQAMGV
jgi:hypothetical protein